MNQNIIIDESAKRILSETICRGKDYVDTKEEVSTGSYAKMQVSKADTIIPENIKENINILNVIGNYSEKASLSFETAPFEYSNLTEEQKEVIEGGGIPLFSFTNIQSRKLNDNEVYLTANVDIDLNVGDTIRTNPIWSVDNYIEDVFEVTQDVVFDSHYFIYEDGGVHKYSFRFDFYDRGETEYDPLICKYDINLYIAEKRVDGGDTFYTIKEKATNTINAYFLGRVDFSIMQGGQEYGVDKSKVFIEFYDNDGTAQVVGWQSSELNDGPNLTNLLYGHRYRVHAYSEDELLVIDSVGEDGVDIQDTTINYPQDIINFSKDPHVWIINNHVKPVQNVYVRDEASDVIFPLFKMSGGFPIESIPEGSGLEIGQSYGVAFSMMPLSQNSNIYINGNLVALSVTYYTFTLTDDLVVDNQVVIKVVKATPIVPIIYYKDKESNVDFILMGSGSSMWLQPGDGVHPNKTYVIKGSMRDMFILPLSNIYINGTLIAKNTSDNYNFILTEDMVANNQVVIKVTKVQ